MTCVRNKLNIYEKTKMNLSQLVQLSQDLLYHEPHGILLSAVMDVP